MGTGIRHLTEEELIDEAPHLLDRELLAMLDGASPCQAPRQALAFLQLRPLTVGFVLCQHVLDHGAFVARADLGRNAAHHHRAPAKELDVEAEGPQIRQEFLEQLIIGR